MEGAFTAAVEAVATARPCRPSSGIRVASYPILPSAEIRVTELDVDSVAASTLEELGPSRSVRGGAATWSGVAEFLLPKPSRG